METAICEVLWQAAEFFGDAIDPEVRASPTPSERSWTTSASDVLNTGGPMMCRP